MTKYRVYLVAVASVVREVEAEDGDEAVAAALDTNLPRTNPFDGYDLGDWMTASELDRTNKPEDDYEEIR